MGKMSDLDLQLAALGWDDQWRMATPLPVAEAVTRNTAPQEAFPTDCEAFGRHLRSVVRLYVNGLQSAGIADPLAARLTVAAVVADLFALVGEPEPPAVANYLG